MYAFSLTVYKTWTFKSKDELWLRPEKIGFAQYFSLEIGIVMPKSVKSLQKPTRSEEPLF